MTWLIFTDSGSMMHSAHPTLEAATRCVYNKIVRGREFRPLSYEADTGDDHCESDGSLTGLRWRAPVRKMTVAEITEQAPPRFRKSWLAGPPMVTDWERASKLVVFVGEPVASVSIYREDRYRQYLDRASICNDVSQRRTELEAAMATCAA